MFKGFKDFLMRGNIIDLAVAVVVGSAFTAVVTAFTNSIIKPLIALAGSNNVQGFGIQLNPSKPATFLDFSVAINAVITFFITAAVVYFLFVLPMQKIQDRRKKGTTTDPTDNELLTEIRDLLRDQQGLSARTSSTLASGDGGSQQTVTTGSTNGESSNGDKN